jgi:uncharacterized protein (DUF2147 family)
MLKIALVAAALVAHAAAFAQTSPVGLWKSIDDKTKKERSLIRIVDSAGTLSGKIEKRLDPDVKPSDVCDKCSDDRKDQPILGLQIIRAVTKSSGTENRWDAGTVLDPEDGKVYKVRLTPVEGGQKLEVRGYIGAPILGRTQTWIRVE